MKYLKKIGIVFGIIIVLGISFYAYMGGFKDVIVEKGTFESEEIFVYTHKGPYQNLNQSWDKFQKDWESIGLTGCNSLAIYLDGPDTPEDKLRSVLGCRMNGLSESQIKAVKTKFQTFLLPQMKCLTASFPFKNFLSYFIAPTKVYPKFHETLSREPDVTSVSIEVYGDSNHFVDHIDFYMPLGINRDVFLPLEKAFESK